jgi:signal transduction histidine kinase
VDDHGRGMASNRRTRTSFAWLAELQGPALVGAGYYLGAELAFAVGTLSDKIFAPFWPPNIVLLCALIIAPYRRWWVYIAAVFLPHAVAELGVGMGWWQLLVAFATNCMFSVLGAFGFRYFVVARPWLGNFNKAVFYVLITAIAAPALAALGGAFVRVVGGGAIADYWLYWEQWYLANALASLTMGAALLCWIDRGCNLSAFSSLAQRSEGLLLAAGLTVACIVALKAGTWTTQNFLPSLLYLPLPLAVWAAVRFRTLGASAAILLVTLISVSLTLSGATVFSRGSAEENVLALQIFLMAFSVPALLLAASVDGMRVAEKTTAALARFVLGAHDEERRRVAKSLHEHIAQNLVSASWAAERLENDADRAAARQLKDTLQQAIRDLRDLSYALHPPLLEEGGLPSALRALVEDYLQRSGIDVALEISETFGRLSSEIELTSFRLVEDALTSLIGDSNGAGAWVRLRREASPPKVIITVALDNAAGTAIRGPSSQAVPSGDRILFKSGLSVARMRERLHRIGGSLETAAGDHGTVVKMLIPVTDER